MAKATTNYYSEQVKDMHFNMVRIDTAAQQKEWIKYSEGAKCVHSCEGISTFKSCLKYFDQPKTEVWVACVSSQPVIDSCDLNGKGIEMYISVTTSEEALFAAHMGIQRVRVENPHKNISVLLHQLCAKTMHALHPEKLVVISSPLQEMRKILFKAFKAAGKSDAVYIYDNFNPKDPFQNFLTRESIEQVNASIEESISKGENLKYSWATGFDIREARFNQREKINTGEIFPGILKDENSELVTFKDTCTGKDINSIKKGDIGFEWFFDNFDLYNNGFSFYSAMVSMKIEELATITDQFSAEAAASAGRDHGASAAAHDPVDVTVLADQGLGVAAEY